MPDSSKNTDSSKNLDMLLTAAEVADHLSVSEASLAQDRYNGVGVPYVKFGSRVRYRLSDLVAYVDANVVETQPPNRPARTHKMRRV